MCCHSCKELAASLNKAIRRCIEKGYERMVKGGGAEHNAASVMPVDAALQEFDAATGTDKAKRLFSCLAETGPLAELQGVMEQEYALAVRLVARHDFAEGVRAQVVDKDKSPQWQPSELADITEQSIDGIFAAMPRGEGLKRDYLD